MNLLRIWLDLLGIWLDGWNLVGHGKVLGKVLKTRLIQTNLDWTTSCSGTPFWIDEMLANRLVELFEIHLENTFQMHLKTLKMIKI